MQYQFSDHLRAGLITLETISVSPRYLGWEHLSFMMDRFIVPNRFSTRLACAFDLGVARLGDRRLMPHMHIAIPIFPNVCMPNFLAFHAVFIAPGWLFGGWLSSGLSRTGFAAFGWLLDARRRYFWPAPAGLFADPRNGHCCYFPVVIADCSLAAGSFDGVILTIPLFPLAFDFRR